MGFIPINMHGNCFLCIAIIALCRELLKLLKEMLEIMIVVKEYSRIFAAQLPIQVFA